MENAFTTELYIRNIERRIIKNIFSDTTKNKVKFIQRVVKEVGVRKVRKHTIYSTLRLTNYYSLQSATALLTERQSLHKPCTRC